MDPTPPTLDYVPDEEDAEAGRTIYFDMDGTIADLYGVQPKNGMDVFQRLDNNDATVYYEAKPIQKYVDLLKEYKGMGYRIGIITAGSRFPPDTPQSTKDQMNKDTEMYKKKWLTEHGLMPYIDSFTFVPYGTSKYEVAEDKTGVLVDDEDKVLNTWFSDKIKAVNDNKARF